MTNRQALLSDLQSLLKTLEADLLARSESADVSQVGDHLRAEYERAKKAERTAQNYEDWRSGQITQTAASWVLSSVFVRFLEDNRLIDPPRFAGPGERLQRAIDEHTLFFRDPQRARLTDREYLLAVFDELAGLPGTQDVFGSHNPLRELPNWLSGDAAGELLKFFQKIDADTGELLHDFTDLPTTEGTGWNTRFLGDLYQELSEAARKKYALLQTPDFVEEFILDRTLEPALDEFGLVLHHGDTKDTGKGARTQQSDLKEPLGSPRLRGESLFRMIDPACGSGHFLLGTFGRILGRWQRAEPATDVRDLVQRTLDSIHGVDVNPFAIAIARFRLLLAAMRACHVTRLADAPGFRLHLACGDSLLHGAGEQQSFGWRDVDHATQAEDLSALRRILVPARYHAVVANPPYITPKDRALNAAYRERYLACHRQYSLAVPFMERTFRLAVEGGYTGQITANSFMKREFGKKLIEEFLPKVDLTHVIDTSGAYIPGHGTPTVILFGRHRKPVSGTVRAVMGIRGEPSTPEDPAQGLVWSAIVTQIDEPGSESEYVSVGDTERERFAAHPWSIGGGGAAELKQTLESRYNYTLNDCSDAIGFLVITGEDNCLLLPSRVTQRQRVRHVRPLGDGDVVRDWRIEAELVTLWPNDCQGVELPEAEISEHLLFLWNYRTSLRNRKAFGIPVEQKGIKWWALRELYADRLRTPLSIVFAFVATHNHFVLDRGGKVFKQSAPVIKLPPDTTEDDHLGLLGLLNSSTACFWMKQVFHDKGSTVDSRGARQTTVAFENFREFTGTGLQKFPLPSERPPELARRLDDLAQQLQATVPASVLTRQTAHSAKPESNEEPQSLRETLQTAHDRYENLRGLMIFLQEELDWECYRLYGLTEENLTYAGDPFPLQLGERSFEIRLARRVSRGVTTTTWFERHRSTPITAPPAHWPEDYNTLYHRRHQIMQDNRSIGLIEQPEYKRRWNTEPWESQLDRALREWLLDRLEAYFDFDGRMQTGDSPPRHEGHGEEQPTTETSVASVSPWCRFPEGQVTTVARLADVARQDAAFMEVAALYQGDPAFDVQKLVDELVRAENVPLLPVLRYKPSGLRKRKEWEHVWELQRREDAIDARTELPENDPDYLNADQARNLKQQDVGDISVPPKYKSSDFLSTGGARYWALRGKLDVPKERWVSFPHCEGSDGTLVIAWAGYDHLQLARAVSAHYVDIQERLGGRDDPRLVPLLACLLELLPWLKQWHNEIDPDFGVPLGDYFEGFVEEERRNLPHPDGTTGWTLEAIRAWEPVKKTRRSKKASSNSATG